MRFTHGPAYRTVHRAIRAAIADGRYRVGDVLPSLAQLQQQFDVSATVARRAVAELRTDGLVEVRAGLGTYVASAVARERAHCDCATVLRDIRAVLAQLADRVGELEAALNQPTAYDHDGVGATGRRADPPRVPPGRRAVKASRQRGPLQGGGARSSSPVS